MPLLCIRDSFAGFNSIAKFNIFLKESNLTSNSFGENLNTIVYRVILENYNFFQHLLTNCEWEILNYDLPKEKLNEFYPKIPKTINEQVILSDEFEDIDFGNLSLVNDIDLNKILFSDSLYENF